MNRLLFCLVLSGTLLLSSCSSMLERSYISTTPHTQFSDEKEDPSILRAETYQGLVSALLHLVEQGKTFGIVRLYQYVTVTGSATSDVDSATLEITQEDPLGAYAVDYMKYRVEQTSDYYQIEVNVAYTKTPQEMAGILSVTGTTAVPQELSPLLPDLPSKVVFRIGYFTETDSADALRQAVLNAYEAKKDRLPAVLQEVTVTLYPKEGSQRVAEILLTWQLPKPSADQPASSIENFLKNQKNIEK